jgi:hypothetical protein
MEEQAMQSTTKNSGKKPYTAPRLTVYGTLEDVTKMPDKTWGMSDGFTFQGVAITNVS